MFDSQAMGERTPVDILWMPMPKHRFKIGWQANYLPGWLPWLIHQHSRCWQRTSYHLALGHWAQPKKVNKQWQVNFEKNKKCWKLVSWLGYRTQESFRGFENFTTKVLQRNDCLYHLIQGRESRVPKERQIWKKT